MAEKHIHKFRRHTYRTGNAVYFCVLDCAFKVATALALGKQTICWRCGETFEMNEYSIRLAKPHCDNCHKPKERRSKTDVILKVPTMPAKVINPTSDLRSRLSGVLHAGLAGKPDDEDI